jgi:mannosyltransferase OCH1-like enzyme
MSFTFLDHETKSDSKRKYKIDAIKVSRGKMLKYAILAGLFVYMMFSSMHAMSNRSNRKLRFANKLKHKPLNIKGTTIPRYIHQTWKTDDYTQADVPDHVRESISAWTSLESFTYFLWNDQDIEDFVILEFPNLYSVYRLLTPIMRTDLFRLLVLYRYGGIVCIFYHNHSIQMLIRYHGAIQIFGQEAY